MLGIQPFSGLLFPPWSFTEDPWDVQGSMILEGPFQPRIFRDSVVLPPLLQVPPGTSASGCCRALLRILPAEGALSAALLSTSDPFRDGDVGLQIHLGFVCMVSGSSFALKRSETAANH